MCPSLTCNWFFILYPRLVTRLNGMSKQYRLPEIIPVPLAYIVCILIVIPAAMATAGSVIAMIILFSPTSKAEVMMLFFMLPNVMTLVNFTFAAPLFAERIQRAVNNISDAQISALVQNQA